MNILLIGYGKMGKTIHHLLNQRCPEHKVCGIITSAVTEEWNLSEKPDVAIEFTRPEAASFNIRTCLSKQIPIVIGTTGWYDKLPEICDEVMQNHGAIFYASNFSLGVNIFFELNRKLALLMQNFPDYEPVIKEIHHLTKRDAPSGTAISLAQGLLETNPSKTHWVNTLASDPSALSILSVREEDVKGTHIIRYQSEVDEISIRHEAYSREGFALGAIRAALWLGDKKGVFTMKDLLGF